VHYRSLRIYQRDFRKKLSRAKLDEFVKMRPAPFAKFQTVSIVKKAIMRGMPECLKKFLLAQSYIRGLEDKPAQQMWQKCEMYDLPFEPMDN